MRCDSSPAIGAPLKVIAPARGTSMPAIVRISDDLPAPFAPMMATIAPCGTSSDTRSRACASP